MKKALLIVLLIFISLFTISCSKSSEDKKINEIVSSMTTKEKVSQMILMACRKRDGVDFTTITPEVSDLLEEYGLAGMILFAMNCVSNDQTYDLINDIQLANDKGNNPGLFIALDQEGGRVVRLEEGTVTPGNMALGAINTSSYTKTIAYLIAGEISALGFNVDFAPVVDINNNPNNPVIGVRSFSDDKEIVSEMTKAYIEGLKENNVIGSLKHFPGHGDTATDSHTGLPLIDKSLDELLDFELIPYINNIKDIDMIMTAHIVYPQIEKETYKSISTGNEITLPATLSKTIITDVLRDRLGYEGVVVTDALEMDAISKHFDKLDVAKLSINAGVDILLMPVDISTENGINELKEYIDDVASLVDNGTIKVELVDKAVTRILKLKQKYNLLDSYTPKDKANISNVGSKENHNIEWEITKKAITLLKNDGNTLPIKENEKTLVLTSDNSFDVAINYALSLANRIASIDLINNAKKPSYDLSKYDKIIIISQMANNNYYSSDVATSIDGIIDNAQKINKKVIILSNNLPYDSARFKGADALVLCYSPKTMSVSPLEESSQIKQYGPNVPCALYLMFNDYSYSGKLPVNIYDLNDKYEITNNILFARGFGLNK